MNGWVINLSKRLLVMGDEGIALITHMLDDDGEITEDETQCRTCVAQLRDGNFVVVDVSQAERQKSH